MNRNALQLPTASPTTTCNARTKNGYCKKIAGHRTDHLGKGRCYLHGGNSLEIMTSKTISKRYTPLGNSMTEKKNL